MRHRAPALLGVIVGALVGAQAALMPAPVAAGAPSSYSNSSATRYQITFAARGCASFADISAGQVPGDDTETLGRPGRATAYRAGQAVDPSVEDDLDAGCTDLPGVRFALGSGHGRTGQVSSVTGDVTTTPPTAGSTARLDPTGDNTGGLIPGAVTVRLTDAQVRLAGHRQLWAQGGSPAQPLPAGYAFGALRCAVDGRTGGNVQWIGYPAEVRHVFCYAYYVRTGDPGGRIVVRVRTSRPLGYPQPVPFASTISYGPDGTFSVPADASPSDATFDRLATPPGGTPYALAPRTPVGWQLTESGCRAQRAGGGAGTSIATVDPPTGKAVVTLATGDVVTCSYLFNPPALPAGLSVRVVTPGAAGSFGLTLAARAVSGNAAPAVPAPGGAPTPGRPATVPAPVPGVAPAPTGLPVPAATGPYALTATTTAGTTPTAVTTAGAPATGADLSGLPAGGYTLTVAPPGTGWVLTTGTCNGTPAAVSGTAIGVSVVAGVPLECVLVLNRRPPVLRLAVVTTGDVATAAYSVVPAATAGPGWWASANTTGYDLPAAAAGDLPAALPFGTYLVTAVAPVSAPTGGWRLTSFGCDHPDRPTGVDGLVQVSLTAGGADVNCTATYETVPTTQLQVTVAPAGSPFGRHGPAIVDVSCVDGSTGRIVVPAAEQGTGRLPDPLAFLDPTTCTVAQTATGAAQTSMVKVSAVIAPGGADGPVELPSQVDVSRDVTQYTVAVTDEFGRPAVVPRRATLLDRLRSLPLAMAGIGVVGIGVLLFLGVLLRRRTRLR